MKVIHQANNTILKLLAPFYKTGFDNRLMHFCVQKEVEKGVLLFNLLTREMVLLTEEEAKNITCNDYLKKHWFVVPNETNEKEYVDIIRELLKKLEKKNSNITTYTIFPTTDCNARCFYCFELGRSRTPMTMRTAEKVVNYIKKNSGENKITLHWFGGEPLLNIPVIDYICQSLKELGIDFKSVMTTNGYLFTKEIADRAAELWQLKNVQITLDGTESVYNKIKAYIYKDVNPYQIVLNNIEHLINANIKVTIRMNMDLYNKDDLLKLCDTLAQRFGDQKNVSAYAHHIFDANIPMSQIHTEEEWEIRDQAMQQIESKLTKSGLLVKKRISNKMKLYHCKADNDSAITILPDGSIGLCEQKTETNYIGHIDSTEFDKEVIDVWKQTVDRIDECATCFAYPECLKLQKCTNSRECYPHYRYDVLRKTQQTMVYEYTNSEAYYNI